MLSHLSGEMRPIIIAGDMNTTDQTTAYRMLTSQYRDSWREAGFGLGLTFPAPVFRLSDIPLPLPRRWKARGGLLDRTVTAGLLRLDHILHSDDFRAVGAQTVVIRQSDHSPQRPRSSKAYACFDYGRPQTPVVILRIPGLPPLSMLV